MGVLNITPDSFSDGGLFFEKDKAVAKGLDMVSQGAKIIDVGGESTRPSSNPIPAEEEKSRIIPVISRLREKTDTLISVDTTKASVAREAIDAGADIINDISAFRFDPDMLQVASEKDVPVVLMHMRGKPKTMQVRPHYKDLLLEVRSFLEERIDTAVASGIKKEKIIIDPGIGFGKSVEDNLGLLRNLNILQELGHPILIGTSRKSFIGKVLNLPVDERLEGTIASAVLGVVYGAHILRVHDVQSIKRAVFLADAIINADPVSGSFENTREKKFSYVC